MWNISSILFNPVYGFDKCMNVFLTIIPLNHIAIKLGMFFCEFEPVVVYHLIFQSLWTVQQISKVGTTKKMAGVGYGMVLRPRNDLINCKTAEIPDFGAFRA